MERALQWDTSGDADNSRLASPVGPGTPPYPPPAPQAPWQRHRLVPSLRRLPDIAAGLERGCMVTDVGCGCGEALMAVATAFPSGCFRHNIYLGRARGRQAGWCCGLAASADRCPHMPLSSLRAAATTATTSQRTL